MGGVSEHSRVLAQTAAAAGYDVQVWTGANGAGLQTASGSGRTLVIFRPPALDRADAALNACAAPRRLIVQWVPHGYGRRGLNVGFSRWLRRRARAGDRIDLIVHEPFMDFFGSSWRQPVIGLVQRLHDLDARSLPRIASGSRFQGGSRGFALPGGQTQPAPQTLPVPGTIPLVQMPRPTLRRCAGRCCRDVPRSSGTSGRAAGTRSTLMTATVAALADRRSGHGVRLLRPRQRCSSPTACGQSAPRFDRAHHGHRRDDPRSRVAPPAGLRRAAAAVPGRRQRTQDDDGLGARARGSGGDDDRCAVRAVLERHASGRNRPGLPLRPCSRRPSFDCSILRETAPRVTARSRSIANGSIRRDVRGRCFMLSGSGGTRRLTAVFDAHRHCHVDVEAGGRCRDLYLPLDCRISVAGARGRRSAMRATSRTIGRDSSFHRR